MIGNLATRRSFSTNRSCLDRRQGTHLPDAFINRNDRIDWSAAEQAVQLYSVQYMEDMRHFVFSLLRYIDPTICCIIDCWSSLTINELASPGSFYMIGLNIKIY